jgi:putative membrane protein
MVFQAEKRGVEVSYSTLPCDITFCGTFLRRRGSRQMPGLETPLTQHVLLHVGAMNVFAPLVIILARLRLGKPTAPEKLLWPATGVQLAFLWFWHIPDILAFGLSGPAGIIIMHASLLMTALLFWHCVCGLVANEQWRAIGALLLTSKLYCLLGVLLTFAPRTLYPGVFVLCLAPGSAPVTIGLADQQFAGLIMLVACPATYLLGAVTLAARWLFTLEGLPAVRLASRVPP